MSSQRHMIEPEELMAYLDGELSPERALETASHLEHCRECQNLADELRQLSHGLMTWTIEETKLTVMPDEIAGALAEKDNSRKPQMRRNWLNVRHWPRKTWAVAATATALVVLLMVATLGRLSTTIERSSLWVSEPSRRRASQTLPSPYLVPSWQSRESSVTRTKLANQAAAETNITANVPMIVRTAQLSPTTRKFESARSKLESILKRYEGYVAKMNVSTPTDSGRSMTATLRFPASQLDEAMAELKTLGRVDAESQGGDEVTQQYVDLEARLDNARHTEQRLTYILRRRTGKLSDVLTVEKEISRVQEQIERMEAEGKNLKNQVDFATLNLKMTDDYKAQLKVVPSSTRQRLRYAAVAGYRMMADSLIVALLWLLSWLPTLLIWALVLFYPARMAWRKLRPRLAQETSEL